MDVPAHTPTQAELPSKQQLNRATLIATAVASVLLITTVLPAEYGYDPTGVGSALGLTPMGKMKAEKASQSPDAARPVSGEGDIVMDDAAAPASDGATGGQQTGEVTLSLAPDEGTEVKATMNAGDEIKYEWRTGGAKVNFELHGEELGAASSDYTSYGKGTSAGESGTFRAPFAGTHGWFWRNRTTSTLQITVKARGTFSKFAQMK